MAVIKIIINMTHQASPVGGQNVSRGVPQKVKGRFFYRSASHRVRRWIFLFQQDENSKPGVTFKDR